MSRAREIADLGSPAASALSNRNLIINGAMQVAQRGTSTTGVGASNGTYPTVDRFMIGVSSTAGRLTMTQEAVSDLPGFAKAIKLACTTIDTSIDAAEFLQLVQKFEGQNLQRLKKGTSSAESVTVSFYVKGNASATCTLELQDADNTRYNSQEFSVTTSWNRVSLTFVGDTSGVLDDDNARSLDCKVWLHAGSNYTGGTHTDNVWHTTTNQRVGDSQTSFFDSTDRTFFITGWQMEIGETATPFEHRTFGDDLAACQRYFQKSYDYGTTIGTNTTVSAMFHRNPEAVSNRTPNITFPVEMRAATTTVVYSIPGTANAASNCSTGFSHSSNITSTNFSGTDGTHGLSRLGLGSGVDDIIGFHYTAEAEL